MLYPLSYGAEPPDPGSDPFAERCAPILRMGFGFGSAALCRDARAT